MPDCPPHCVRLSAAILLLLLRPAVAGGSLWGLRSIQKWLCARLLRLVAGCGRRCTAAARLGHGCHRRSLQLTTRWCRTFEPAVNTHGNGSGTAAGTYFKLAKKHVHGRWRRRPSSAIRFAGALTPPPTPYTWPKASCKVNNIQAAHSTRLLPYKLPYLATNTERTCVCCSGASCWLKA